MNQDEINLRLLREFTLEKSNALRINLSDSILEIGPPRIVDALNSPIYERNPDWYFDLEEKCNVAGASYMSLDMDEGVKPNILGSLEDAELELPLETFDQVICYSILEHCQDLVRSIENIRKSLKRNGQVHFLTPWDLRFHGPRPDCWRISDDGYRWLLRDKFEILDIEYLQQRERELSPIAIYVNARKL